MLFYSLRFLGLGSGALRTVRSTEHRAPVSSLLASGTWRTSKVPASPAHQQAHRAPSVCLDWDRVADRESESFSCFVLPKHAPFGQSEALLPFIYFLPGSNASRSTSFAFRIIGYKGRLFSVHNSCPMYSVHSASQHLQYALPGQSQFLAIWLASKRNFQGSHKYLSQVGSYIALGRYYYPGILLSFVPSNSIQWCV